MIAFKRIKKKRGTIFFGHWSRESSVFLESPIFSVSGLFLKSGRADQHITNVCFARDPCIRALIIVKACATIDQSKKLQDDPRRAATADAADKQGKAVLNVVSKDPTHGAFLE